MKVKLLLAAWCLCLFGTTTSTPLVEHPKIQTMHEVATRYRLQSGLHPQELDESLCALAQRWANHMASYNAMFHGGGEQVIAQGYPNEESCIRGWLNSPAHRVWVMGGHQRCGFGCQRGSDGRWYWAGVFR